MRSLLIAFGLAAAVPLAASLPASAADNQAGTPLAPGEAAGPWTLESAGHSVCVLSLTGRKTSAGVYGLRIPSDCGGALPPGLTGWAPAGDGMDLVTADGAKIPFERWSNSLLVARQGSGLNLQLRRGAGGE
jgi:hypothetical protein